MPAIFKTTPGRQILLASASPRRQELLQSLGISFSSHKSAFPETPPLPDEPPAKYAARMAKAKALAAKADSALIIAADTVVALENSILGKPASEADALAMLMRLNGRVHRVYTAVQFLPPSAPPVQFCSVSQVTFASWPESTLAAYIHAWRPFDKAGAYGIQDAGGFLVKRLEGSYTNVMGLPVSEVAATLLKLGYIQSAGC